MRYLFNYTLLFLIGGTAYCIIELLWRSKTHYSMFFAGGIIFIILSFVGLKMETAPLIQKCLLGMIIITAIEFIFGYIFNIKFNMNVWDYSNMPLNFLGQICMPFSILWFFLCIIIYKLILNNNFYNFFFK